MLVLSVAPWGDAQRMFVSGNVVELGEIADLL